MKILIGTPIHQVKDYCMEKWIQNVSKLMKKTPCDVLLVDNTPGIDYVKRVKDYCQKHRIKNVTITHLELPPEQKIFERVARCREIIRQHLLSRDYDAWFSWECDQLIPEDALDKLVHLLNSGNFIMVNHNNWARENGDIPNHDWGVALIRRKALEKYSFILAFGTDPDMPDTWEPGEKWFKKQVLRSGEGFIEVDGVIEPVYHLDK